MNKSPCDGRKLEGYRSSIEMVNLFLYVVAFMKKKCQRRNGLKKQKWFAPKTGVSDGLTTQPKIIVYRNGPKAIFNLVVIAEIL